MDPLPLSSADAPKRKKETGPAAAKASDLVAAVCNLGLFKLKLWKTRLNA